MPGPRNSPETRAAISRARKGKALGNQNAVTHGINSYLVVGSLPKGASYIRRLIGRLERSLRDAVQSEKGEIRLYDAAVIQTACRHEGRAQLLTRWLRKADTTSAKPLPLMDRLAILREIGSASDSRDRCLKALGLDRDTRANLLDALYGPANEESPRKSLRRRSNGRKGAYPTPNPSGPNAPRNSHDEKEDDR